MFLFQDEAGAGTTATNETAEAGAEAATTTESVDAAADLSEASEKASDAADKLMSGDFSGGSADLIEMGKEYVVPYGTRVIGVLVLLFIAWIIARWISSITRKGMERAKIDTTLTKFASNMVRWLVLILAGLACLSVFGIQTTSFAALIGAAGLALGLAFQGTLGNMSAGVMLLVFRPFKVGDAVNIGGETGLVNEVGLFTTEIDTFDNRRFIIPNGEIFGTTIENITYHPRRRADVAVGVEYGADIDKTREVLEAAANRVPGRLEDPAPVVFLSELGGSSVDWSVRVWAPTADFGAVKQATIREVKNSLDEAGIGIPYPTMDVNLTQPVST